MDAILVALASHASRLGVHRLGVGMGIDGMPGVGDMLGMFAFGIFMSFIMEAQQSFDCAGGGSAFIMG